MSVKKKMIDTYPNFDWDKNEIEVYPGIKLNWLPPANLEENETVELQRIPIERGDLLFYIVVAAYRWPGGGEIVPFISTRNRKDNYIGDVSQAIWLADKGIEPELAKPDANVCSIGYNKELQRWFGWSHRGFLSFGVGSKVRKGHAAYNPANPEDFLENQINFWKCDGKEAVTGFFDEQILDEKPQKGVTIQWRYNNTIPNIAMRNTISSLFVPFPSVWGRGEWNAETISDAMQMAIDYAENVG